MAQAVLQKKDALTGRTFVEFKEHFCVFPDAPMPEYTQPSALAFQACEKGNSVDNLYALIYHPQTPPRLEVLESIKLLNDPNLFTLVDWGVIDWPQPVSRRICVLFQKIQGQLLFNDMSGIFESFSEDELSIGLIEPCYRIFEAFALRGVTYRSLRTTNLYVSEKGRRHLILGDCTNFYPAFTQPALFETVESALTTPCARGDGAIADDLYALGVTIAVLTLGYHPFAGMSDDHIIEQKLMSGSFGAIVGNSKISVSLLEPLKGLLIDDPYDRWTLKDLQSWIDGRRLNARQPIVPKRATRPFSFDGRDYYHLDILLLGLMRNTTKGMSILKNHQFHHWLKRGLAQENLSLEIETQYENLIKSGVSATPEKMTSRLLMSINHHFPIFFKGLSFQIKGIGNAIAYYFDKIDNRQIAAEVISSRLAVHWIGSQKKSLPQNTKMLDVLEKAPRILNSADLGQGIERILYELNTFYPCMSPLIRDWVVLSVDDILPMLEKIAPANMGQTEPFDRHILAYIAAKGRAIGEGLISSFKRDFKSPNPALAPLRLYAQLQMQMRKKNKMTNFPNLAKWVLTYSPKGVICYNNLERQKTVEKKLAEIAEDGDLVALLESADNLILTIQDRHEYNDARRFYTEISSFITLLEDEKKDIDKISVLIGARIAALVSTIASVIAILIILFRFL